MIGEHKVGVVPDPSLSPWTAPLNSNAEFAADLAGWSPIPFEPAASWVWAAPGVARWVSGNVILRRAAAAGIARDPAVSTYRVTVKGHVKVPVGPAWVIPGLSYGTTAEAAYGGEFWAPGRAVDQSQWWGISAEQDYEFTLLSDARTVAPEFGFLGPNIALYANPQAGMTFTVDSIVLQGQAFDYIDISCLVDTVGIVHGRAGATGQPDASTTTIDLSYSSETEALPVDLDVGSLLRIETVVAGERSVRFSGRVTDLRTGWDDTAEDTPVSVVSQIIGAGPLADAGRRLVGDEPWPQELDGARVFRIMNAAGYPLDGVTSDPGTVQVLAQDVDRQAALGLAQEVATSGNGILWETRTGAIRYADAAHRSGTPAALVLDACDVLVTPTWRRDTDGMVNAISLGYGVAPDGGEQPRYNAERADSQARYGLYEFSVTTMLAALADAQAMASLVLTRNRMPVWILSELPVAVADLDLAQTRALLALDVHDLLEVSALPTTGVTPSNTALWVEGWTETLREGAHELALYVSGYCRTSPPPTWDNVPEAWTWNTLPAPAITWDDASCFGPAVSVGRWVDVPASTRWNFVPVGTTWDTWKG